MTEREVDIANEDENEALLEIQRELMSDMTEKTMLPDTKKLLRHIKEEESIETRIEKKVRVHNRKLIGQKIELSLELIEPATMIDEKLFEISPIKLCSKHILKEKLADINE